MQVVGGLSIAKDTNVKYPFGANIKNETDISDGTPVIREIYGDVLMNLYEIMRGVGVVPNGIEDNSSTQFQLVEAFKKFSNEINDVNHVLTLSGTIWNLPIDLNFLPNNFICFAKVTDDYVSSETYTLKGISDLELPFSSIGFKSGEQVLIVIKTDDVKAFSLEKLQEVSDTVYTPLGSPISFNDTNKMYYKENGYLLTDLPSSDEIQQLIRLFSSDGTLMLNDVYIHNNKIICFCHSLDNVYYPIYDIDINDFNNITQIAILSNGGDFDYNPYAYLDVNGVLFVTNKGNDNAGDNDFDISKFERDIDGNFEFVSMTPINSDFEKTTNAVIHNGFIYTFVSGYLRKYNLTTGIKTDVLYLPTVNGQLFRFNGEVYFTTGEVAKKWLLS